MARRLGRFGLGVNALGTLRCALALLAVGGVGLGAGPAGAVELAAGVDAGYAFRSQADGRNHGAAAAVFVDAPLPFVGKSPFGLRAEVLTLAFGPSEEVAEGLALFAGAVSLVYAFDDTDVRALAAIGPLGGLSVDGSRTELGAGALGSLALRLPIADAASVEARVGLPVVLAGARGVTAPGQTSYADGTAVAFPLQATFFVGFTVDIERAFARAGEGDNATLPSLPGTPDDDAHDDVPSRMVPPPGG